MLLLSLYQQKNDYYDVFSKEVVRLANAHYNYTFQAFEEVNWRYFENILVSHYCIDPIFIDQIDPVVTNYYDTAIMYANIINLAVKAGQSPLDGPKMSARTRNFNFTSLVNGVVKLDPNGDRINNFAAKSFNPISGKFEVILYPCYTRMKPDL